VDLRLGEKLTFPKRKAIQTFDDDHTKDTSNRDYKKDADDEALIKKAVLANKNISSIMQLSDEQVHTIVRGNDIN
jgi:hypothetical protein